MIPRNHPAPRGPVVIDIESRLGSTWSECHHTICDGVLEAWLFDQLGLSTLDWNKKINLYADLAKVLQDLRASWARKQCVETMCKEAIPKQLQEWQLHKVNEVY